MNAMRATWRDAIGRVARNCRPTNRSTNPLAARRERSTVEG
jgi:hypothetical protein